MIYQSARYSFQSEDIVAVQSEPLSGEPPAELTVTVDRNLTRRYENITMYRGTAIERQPAGNL
jgi:hypothetical protein